MQHVFIILYSFVHDLHFEFGFMYMSGTFKLVDIAALLMTKHNKLQHEVN